MVRIEIERKSCINCGKCVKVCPSRVFGQSITGGTVEVRRAADCIVCGHCAAVCPTASVIHSAFPPSKVHPTDFGAMPTAESLMTLIRQRRSMRVFSGAAVPESKLDAIIQAAHYAPTATNLQEVEFTLVTDPDVLHEVSRYTIETFERMIRMLSNPLLKVWLKPLLSSLYRYEDAFRQMRAEFDKGNDMILRGATALLLIHVPKRTRFGVEDSNLAYQNASLMAESLGVGQFYTGFVMTAIKKGRSGDLLSRLSIKGDVCAAMALGIPQLRYPNYIERKDLKVNKI